MLLSARPVPLYYFELLNGDGRIGDDTGKDFPDLEAARRHALKAAGQMIADEMAGGRDSLHLTIFIENEAREELMTLPLSLSLGG
jgi:hypothetical protein